MEATNVEAVRSMTNKDMIIAIIELQKAVAELTAKVNAPKPEVTEMTDDHAKRVTYGDLKDLKHKAAAEKLGLTYGQIYSCRLEFTFKDVHKAAKAEGLKNAWTKA
jgi:hypothetical protein